MSLSAISYKSRAVSWLQPADLEALLFAARAFNAHSNVTGVLLVADGRFFQYFEGPPQSVETVFSRILASRYHFDVELLYKGPVPSRLFETWHMAFAEVPEGIFLHLAEADWQADLGAPQARLQSSALQAVLAEWQHCGHTP